MIRIKQGRGVLLAAIGCIVLLAVTLGSTRFSTSVLDLLPQKDLSTDILRELAEKTQGKQLNLHLYTQDARLNDDATSAFLESLERSESIAQVWTVGPDGIRAAGSDLFAKRYLWLFPKWLDEQFGDSWLNGAITEDLLAQRVTTKLKDYLESPDGMALVDLIPKDPFLLMQAVEDLSEIAHPETNPGDKLLWLEQRFSPFSPQGQDAVFSAIDQALKAAQAIQPGIEVEYSGVSVFASESEKAIKHEIQRLNTLGIALVLFLTLVCVRNLRTIASIALVLLMSLLGASTAVIAVFDSVHVIALVIGSILTGVAVDYGLHLFLHEEDQLPDHLAKKAVIAGSLSSAVGFFALLLTPLPFLRQVGFFVGTGLLTALLTALAIRSPKRTHSRINAWAFKPDYLPRWFGLSFILLGLPGIFLLQCQNSIRDLEYPLPDLRAMDTKLRDLSKPGDIDSVYLVTGPDIHAARERLQALDPKGHLSHLGKIIPTADEMIAAHEFAVKQTQFITELEQALEENGFHAGAFEEFYKDWNDYVTQRTPLSEYEETVAQFSSKLPGPLKSFLHLGDHLSWFMVLASKAQSIEESASVLQLDQTKMLSEKFSHYGKTLSAYSSLFLVLLALSVCLYFGFRAGLQALLVPTFSMLTAFGLLGYFQGQIGLFNIIGAMLAFCISLDYGLFRTVSKNVGSKLPKSVTISSLTTLAAFGILATCHIPGVQQLGLTILLIVGLSLIFMQTPLPFSPRRENLFKKIPHGESAIMVRDIIELESEKIRVVCHPHAQQAMPPECLIEAMAQAAALLLAHKTSSPERRVGMLVVVQSSNSEVHCLLPEQVIHADVTLESKVSEGLVQCEGKCYDQSVKELIKSRFAIYRA